MIWIDTYGHKRVNYRVFAGIWGNKGISLAWEAPTGGGKVRKKKPLGRIPGGGNLGKNADKGAKCCVHGWKNGQNKPAVWAAAHANRGEYHQTKARKPINQPKNRKDQD